MLLRLSLTMIFLLAAALRLWRLDQNGFGNEYYAAGVRSMSAGWHNFLYHAFDPAGFLSVDKPPVAMWIQVAAVKLFGFHGLSVLLPQVLEGLVAVWLVYHMVRSAFGTPAGLLAALFLAVTPVSVAVDRSSNTESCLLLFLLLAAWVLTRATEGGSRGTLLLAMALVGVAFNVKMLAAFVVLPTFALVYFLGPPVGLRRRLVDLALGGLVLTLVSASWVTVYDLTPKDKRPYAGTTDSNSVRELMVGPYGIGRFVRQPRPSAIAATESGTGPADAAGAAGDAGRGAPLGPRAGWARLFVGTPVGPLRLSDGQLAGQTGWLFPLALAGLALGALREPMRRPLAPAHLAIVLWAGWALTYAVVYSAAGGFFHFYYLATLAPPLAALAGIGAVGLWRWSVEGGWRATVVMLALVLNAAWQLYIDSRALDGYEGWQSWLHRALVGGTLVGVAALAVCSLRLARSRIVRGMTACALGVGVAALLILPLAWALSSVLVAGDGVLPSADLARLLADSGSLASRPQRRAEASANVSRLVSFLTANRQGERYLLATSTTMLAAPIIIQTGQPVMARGGFHGLDPILTPEKLDGIAAAGQVRFVMLGDLSLVSRRLGAEVAQEPIARWVRSSGKLVDPALWRPPGSRRTAMRLYDLRSDVPLVPALAGSQRASPDRRVD
ncbi:MAG TPA: glycosyltransferase family 39 protein [Methylomirabilota bacterium]|nr:glycosyltransferase family 39 protein [Methylomirabilota bacterium]